MNYLKKYWSQTQESVFEHEYKLLHEILKALHLSGFEITEAVIPEKGTIPFYEFQIQSAHLTFGTAGAVVNDYEKYSELARKEFQVLNRLNITKEEVQETKYKWKEIATSVHTLKFYGDIVLSTNQKFFDLDKKTLFLTEQGFYRYNSKFYLKDANIEKNKRQIHFSTIITNILMTLLSLVIATTSIYTCSSKNSTITPELNKMELKIKFHQRQIDSIREIQKGIQKI